MKLFLLNGIQEVERLQGEVNRLQENARTAEVMSSKFEVLQRELANVSTVAERERRNLEKAARVQFSSLKEENKKLASEAAVFAHKLQETEDVVRVRVDNAHCVQWLPIA